MTGVEVLKNSIYVCESAINILYNDCHITLHGLLNNTPFVYSLISETHVS